MFSVLLVGSITSRCWGNEPANPGDGGNRAYSPRVKSYYIFRGGGGEANYSNLEWLLQARLISHFYKISNIVRAL